ncbi:MAG: hypothetical protein ABSG63_19320 [Spirochaetia bacterium]|jgi:uncharacterized membrane protein
MNALPVASSFFGSPFPWVVLAGLLIGAAVSRATMRTANRRNPERARTHKWVFSCLYLSLAVIFGLLALFIPGPSRILDVRLAWTAGGAAVLAFVVMRFKKALGIPITVLVLAVLLLFGLFLQSLRAFTGETQIATVRVISVDNASMKLELAPRGGQPVMLSMDGQYFAPIVKVVIFDDFFVFMGAKTWYRFEGMTSFDGNLRQRNSDYRFPRSAGMSEQIWAFFEQNESRIPGVKTAQIELAMKKAREFARYAIMVQNDGGVEIVPESG